MMTELSRLDFLILQLINANDHKFVEKVLSEYRGKVYDQLPKELSGKLHEVLEERLFQICEDEAQA